MYLKLRNERGTPVLVNMRRVEFCRADARGGAEVIFGSDRRENLYVLESLEEIIGLIRGASRTSASAVAKPAATQSTGG